MKQYHPKYYPQPKSGTGFKWKNPRTGEEKTCRGIEWYVDYLDAAGDRVREKAHKGYCTCPARKIGTCVHEQMARDLLTDLVSGAVDPKTRQGQVEQPTPAIVGHDLKAYFDSYLAELECSPGHSDSYVISCRRTFKEFGEFCDSCQVHTVERVDRPLMRAYRAYAQGKPRPDSESRSAATVNRHIREVGAALSRAVLDKLLPANPAAFIHRNDRITIPVKDEEPLTILTDEELATLLNLGSDDLKGLFRQNAQIYLDMMTLFYHCGLRKGEVINLTFAQVRDGYICIEPHHKWRPKWGICRKVPMTPEVEAVITRRQEADTTAEYVFQTTTGELFGERNVGRDFEKLYRKYGIVTQSEHFYWHDGLIAGWLQETCVES